MVSNSSLKQNADQALDTTRDVARDTIERAGEKVDNLRTNIEPALDELADKAQKLAHRGIEYASEQSARAQKTFNRYADVTSRYVSEQPTKSVLIAVAIGAAVAALVVAASSRDRRY